MRKNKKEFVVSELYNNYRGILNIQADTVIRMLIFKSKGF